VRLVGQIKNWRYILFQTKAVITFVTMQQSASQEELCLLS